MYSIYVKEFLDGKDDAFHKTTMCLLEIPSIMKCEIYHDRGYRSDINDPDFYRMLKDIKEGSIKRVIVFSIDDIREHLYENLNVISLFENYGISFLFVKEAIDTGSIMGRAKYQAIVYADIIS